MRADAPAIVLVFSSLAWAVGSLYSRHAPLPRRPLVAAAMQMLAAGLILVVVSAVSGEFGQVHPGSVSLESWLGLAYLVVAGSLARLQRVHVAAPRNARPRSSARTHT